jgi:hypothetical protein
MVNVAARFELGSARAADVWPSDGEQLTNRLVLGLAQFFSAQDIDRLDEGLAQLAAAARVSSREATIGCRVDMPGGGVRFACRDSANGKARLEGSVKLQGTRVEAGELATLTLENEAPLYLLAVKEGN